MRGLAKPGSARPLLQRSPAKPPSASQLWAQEVSFYLALPCAPETFHSGEALPETLLPAALLPSKRDW